MIFIPSLPQYVHLDVWGGEVRSFLFEFHVSMVTADSSPLGKAEISETGVNDKMG